MTKEEVKNYLTKGGTLYLVGLRQGTNKKTDKGMWRYFSLYTANGNGLLNKIMFDRNILSTDPPPGIKVKGLQYKHWQLHPQCYTVRGACLDKTYVLVRDFSGWLFGKTDYMPFKYKLLN